VYLRKFSLTHCQWQVSRRKVKNKGIIIFLSEGIKVYSDVKFFLAQKPFGKKYISSAVKNIRKPPSSILFCIHDSEWYGDFFNLSLEERVEVILKQKENLGVGDFVCFCFDLGECIDWLGLEEDRVTALQSEVYLILKYIFEKYKNNCRKDVSGIVKAFCKKKGIEHYALLPKDAVKTLNEQLVEYHCEIIRYYGTVLLVTYDEQTLKLIWGRFYQDGSHTKRSRNNKKLQEKIQASIDKYLTTQSDEKSSSAVEQIYKLFLSYWKVKKSTVRIFENSIKAVIDDDSNSYSALAEKYKELREEWLRVSENICNLIGKNKMGTFNQVYKLGLEDIVTLKGEDYLGQEIISWKTDVFYAILFHTYDEIFRTYGVFTEMEEKVILKSTDEFLSIVKEIKPEINIQGLKKKIIKNIFFANLETLLPKSFPLFRNNPREALVIIRHNLAAFIGKRELDMYDRATTAYIVTDDGKILDEVATYLFYWEDLSHLEAMLWHEFVHRLALNNIILLSDKENEIVPWAIFVLKLMPKTRKIRSPFIETYGKFIEIGKTERNKKRDNFSLKELQGAVVSSREFEELFFNWNGGKKILIDTACGFALAGYCLIDANPIKSTLEYGERFLSRRKEDDSSRDAISRKEKSGNIGASPVERKNHSDSMRLGSDLEIEKEMWIALYSTRSPPSVCVIFVLLPHQTSILLLIKYRAPRILSLPMKKKLTTSPIDKNRCLSLFSIVASPVEVLENALRKLAREELSCAAAVALKMGLAAKLADKFIDKGESEKYIPYIIEEVRKENPGFWIPIFWGTLIQAPQDIAFYSKDINLLYKAAANKGNLLEKNGFPALIRTFRSKLKNLWRDYVFPLGISAKGVNIIWNFEGLEKAKSILGEELFYKYLDLFIQIGINEKNKGYNSAQLFYLSTLQKLKNEYRDSLAGKLPFLLEKARLAQGREKSARFSIDSYRRETKIREKKVFNNGNAIAEMISIILIINASVSDKEKWDLIENYLLNHLRRKQELYFKDILKEGIYSYSRFMIPDFIFLNVINFAVALFYMCDKNDKNKIFSNPFPHNFNEDYWMRAAVYALTGDSRAKYVIAKRLREVNSSFGLYWNVGLIDILREMLKISDSEKPIAERTAYDCKVLIKYYQERKRWGSRPFNSRDSYIAAHNSYEAILSKGKEKLVLPVERFMGKIEKVMSEDSFLVHAASPIIGKSGKLSSSVVDNATVLNAEENFLSDYSDWLHRRYLKFWRMRVKQRLERFIDYHTNTEAIEELAGKTFVVLLLASYVKDYIGAEYLGHFMPGEALNIPISEAEMHSFVDLSGLEERMMSIANMLAGRLLNSKTLSKEQSGEECLKTVRKLWQMFGIDDQKQRDKKERLLREWYEAIFKTIGSPADLKRRRLVSKFKELTEHKQDFPIKTIGFSLTQDCGNNCGHCSVVYRVDSDMSKETLHKIIEFWEQKGVTNFVISGGESFTLQIDKVIAILTKARVPVSIFTNGEFAGDENNTERFISRVYRAAEDKIGEVFIPEAGPFGVILQISMDGFHQEVIRTENNGFGLKEKISIKNIVRILCCIAEKFPRIRVNLISKESKDVGYSFSEKDEKTRVCGALVIEFSQQDFYDPWLSRLLGELKNRNYRCHRYSPDLLKGWRKFLIKNLEGIWEWRLIPSKVAIGITPVHKEEYAFTLNYEPLAPRGWAYLLDETEHLLIATDSKSFFRKETDSTYVSAIKMALGGDEVSFGLEIVGDGNVYFDAALLNIWSLGNINNDDRDAREIMEDIYALLESDPLIYLMNESFQEMISIAQKVEPQIVEKIKKKPYFSIMLLILVGGPAMRLYLTQRYIQKMRTKGVITQQALDGLQLQVPIENLQEEYRKNRVGEPGFITDALTSSGIIKEALALRETEEDISSAATLLDYIEEIGAQVIPETERLIVGFLPDFFQLSVLSPEFALSILSSSAARKEQSAKSKKLKDHWDNKKWSAKRNSRNDDVKKYGRSVSETVLRAKGVAPKERLKLLFKELKECKKHNLYQILLVLNQIAKAYLEEGSYKEAQKWILEAMKKAEDLRSSVPSNYVGKSLSVSQSILTDIYLSWGKKDEAIASAQDFIDLDKTNPTAYGQAFDVYMKLGLYKDAQDALNKYSNLFPNKEDISLKRERLEKALSCKGDKPLQFSSEAKTGSPLTPRGRFSSSQLLAAKDVMTAPFKISFIGLGGGFLSSISLGYDRLRERYLKLKIGFILAVSSYAAKYFQILNVAVITSLSREVYKRENRPQFPGSIVASPVEENYSDPIFLSAGGCKGENRPLTISSPLIGRGRIKSLYPIDDLLLKVKNMPSYDFIKALNLHQAKLVSKRKDDSVKLEIHTIRVPRRRNPLKPPVGLEVLHNELAPVREFELLYSKVGYLEAIVPVLTDKMKKNLGKDKFFYFDLTAFNFEIPKIGDPTAKAKWVLLAARRCVAQELTRLYLEDQGISEVVLPLDGGRRGPYVYLEFDLKENYVIQADFYPEHIVLYNEGKLGWPLKDKLDRMFSIQPENYQIILPVYATVYGPQTQNYSDNDYQYIQAVLFFGENSRLQEGEQSLVVGPGMGIDVLAARLTTGRPVYCIGINPLEVAEIHFLARHAGFQDSIKVILGDNLIDKRVKAFLKDIVFQLVFINSPYEDIYAGKTRRFKTLFKWQDMFRIRFGLKKPHRLSCYWDSMRKKFMRDLSRGLPKRLDHNRGLVVLWTRIEAFADVDLMIKETALKILEKCCMDPEEQIEYLYILGYSDQLYNQCCADAAEKKHPMQPSSPARELEKQMRRIQRTKHYLNIAASPINYCYASSNILEILSTLLKDGYYIITPSLSGKKVYRQKPRVKKTATIFIHPATEVVRLTAIEQDSLDMFNNYCNDTFSILEDDDTDLKIVLCSNIPDYLINVITRIINSNFKAPVMIVLTEENIPTPLLGIDWFMQFLFDGGIGIIKIAGEELLYAIFPKHEAEKMYRKLMLGVFKKRSALKSRYLESLKAKYKIQPDSIYKALIKDSWMLNQRFNINNGREEILCLVDGCIFNFFHKTFFTSRGAPKENMQVRVIWKNIFSHEFCNTGDGERIGKMRVFSEVLDEFYSRSSPVTALNRKNIGEMPGNIAVSPVKARDVPQELQSIEQKLRQELVLEKYGFSEYIKYGVVDSMKGLYSLAQVFDKGYGECSIWAFFVVKQLIDFGVHKKNIKVLRVEIPLQILEGELVSDLHFMVKFIYKEEAYIGGFTPVDEMILGTRGFIHLEDCRIALTDENVKEMSIDDYLAAFKERFIFGASVLKEGFLEESNSESLDKGELNLIFHKHVISDSLVTRYLKGKISIFVKVVFLNDNIGFGFYMLENEINLTHRCLQRKWFVSFRIVCRFQDLPRFKQSIKDIENKEYIIGCLLKDSKFNYLRKKWKGPMNEEILSLVNNHGKDLYYLIISLVEPTLTFEGVYEELQDRKRAFSQKAGNNLDLPNVIRLLNDLRAYSSSALEQKSHKNQGTRYLFMWFETREARDSDHFPEINAFKKYKKWSPSIVSQAYPRTENPWNHNDLVFVENSRGLARHHKSFFKTIFETYGFREINCLVSGAGAGREVADIFKIYDESGSSQELVLDTVGLSPIKDGELLQIDSIEMHSIWEEKIGRKKKDFFDFTPDEVKQLLDKGVELYYKKRNINTQYIFDAKTQHDMFEPNKKYDIIFEDNGPITKTFSFTKTAPYTLKVLDSMNQNGILLYHQPSLPLLPGDVSYVYIKNTGGNMVYKKDSVWAEIFGFNPAKMARCVEVEEVVAAIKQSWESAMLPSNVQIPETEHLIVGFLPDSFKLSVLSPEFEGTYLEKPDLFSSQRNFVDMDSTKEFLKLIYQQGVHFAIDFLSLLDWYGNILVGESTEMSMEFNFISMGKLSDGFYKHNLGVTNAEYFGFEKDMLHRTPLGVLLFTKSPIRGAPAKDLVSGFGVLSRGNDFLVQEGITDIKTITRGRFSSSQLLAAKEFMMAPFKISFIGPEGGFLSSISLGYRGLQEHYLKLKTGFILVVSSYAAKYFQILNAVVIISLSREGCARENRPLGIQSRINSSCPYLNIAASPIRQENPAEFSKDADEIKENLRKLAEGIDYNIINFSLPQFTMYEIRQRQGNPYIVKVEVESRGKQFIDVDSWGFVVAEIEEGQAVMARGLGGCCGLFLRGIRNLKNVHIIQHSLFPPYRNIEVMFNKVIPAVNAGGLGIKVLEGAFAYNRFCPVNKVKNKIIPEKDEIAREYERTIKNLLEPNIFNIKYFVRGPGESSHFLINNKGVVEKRYASQCEGGFKAEYNYCIWQKKWTTRQFPYAKGSVPSASPIVELLNRKVVIAINRDSYYLEINSSYPYLPIKKDKTKGKKGNGSILFNLNLPMKKKLTTSPIDKNRCLSLFSNSRSSPITLLNRNSIGAMPVVYDKSRLLEGRLSIFYNPNKIAGIPTMLIDPKEVFARYSCDGWNSHYDEGMSKTSQGLWRADIDNIKPRAYKIELAFSDGKNWDSVFKIKNIYPANYRACLFKGPGIDCHAHITIDLDVHGLPPENDRYLIPAFVSGYIEGAAVTSRNNMITDRILRQYPQLRGYAWVTLSDTEYYFKVRDNPQTPMPRKSNLGEIMQLLKRNPQFVGLKLHPVLDKVQLNSQEVKLALDELSKLSHPWGIKYVVLVHLGEGYTGEYSEPYQLKELAEQFSNIIFIAGHSYYGDAYWNKKVEVANLAREFNNVFLEFSGVNPWERILDLISIAGVPNVLYGSDAQSEDHYHKDKYHYVRLIDFLHENLPNRKRDLASIMSANPDKLFHISPSYHKNSSSVYQELNPHIRNKPFLNLNISSPLDKIKFDFYEPSHYYHQICKELLWENNYDCLDQLLKNFDIDRGRIRKIEVQPYWPSYRNSNWYVLKVDFKLQEAVLETIYKVLEVGESVEYVSKVRKACRVFKDTDAIAQMYLYREFKGEHIFFFEYVPHDESLVNDEIIAEKIFYCWYYSSPDALNSRWIFADGDDWRRGNIRFYKDEDKINAKLVGLETHRFISDANEVVKWLVRHGHRRQAVLKGMKKEIAAVRRDAAKGGGSLKPKK